MLRNPRSELPLRDITCMMRARFLEAPLVHAPIPPATGLLRVSMPETPLRNPRLDGVRGLAILLVMGFHTAQFGLAHAPADVALLAPFALGWSGVDLFFVLSGFLITGILLETRSSSSYARTFYARRTLRIFPLYYAVLVFFLIVAPRIEGLADIEAAWRAGPGVDGLWYWLYLTNVDLARDGAWGHNALSVTWSLAIEEHFYLVWPWIVLRVTERQLLLACAVIAVLALGIRLALLASGASSIAVYVLTPCRLDTLATGAAVALLARRPGGLARLARPARVVFLVTAWIFVTAVVYLRLQIRDLPRAGLAARDTISLVMDPLMQTLGYSALCLIWGSLLVLILVAPASARLAKGFEFGALRSLGQYSYGLYLLHLPVAITLGVAAPAAPFRRHFAIAQFAFWTLAIGGSYGLARLSWILIEMPFLRLKRHFPYRV